MSIRLCFVLLTAVVLMAIGQVAPVYAATITVTTFNDELNSNGRCSLREAIRAVNLRSPVDSCSAGDGDDRIILAAGTYRLTIPGQNENEALTGDLDIITAVAGRLTIRGAGAERTIIHGNGLDRVLHVVNENITLTLVDLSIRGGRLTDAAGAGILNLGTLALNRVIVANNLISGTESAAVGGGLCTGCGLATGQTIIRDSVFRNNSADRGGAIFSNRPFTLTASSIISNTARAGGGIMSYGDLFIVNSTLSNNGASNNGGAIVQHAGVLRLRYSTVSHNTAPLTGGVRHNEGTSELQGVIVAQNSGGNCGGAIVSLGHNLSSDSGCPFTAGGDHNKIDPLLGPLQHNGGETPTRALLIGSPAIDAGGAGCPATDQRGVTRPQGLACDIGAFEGVFFFNYLPTVRREGGD